jgi:predicted CoA-substrate-specific enzyme activase
MPEPALLGVDIGSVSLSSCLLGADGETLRTAYLCHKGKPRETLLSVLDQFAPLSLSGIAFTSASAPLLRGARVFDSQVSLIAACRRWIPEARSILFAGGERFGLIRFDDKGSYRGTRSNSSCAAGTGSFLDQQARRLGFSGVEELANRALENSAPPPKISTRCAVFARTDLVHAQQSGHTLEEICDGLCRGLAQNIADALLGGDKPEPPVAFAGGVSLNAAVRRHIEELFGVPVVTHELAPVFGALGAALCLREQGVADWTGGSNPEALLLPKDERQEYFFAPLSLSHEDGPGRDGERSWTFGAGRFSGAHPVEVEIYREAVAGDAMAVTMGLDIGSTSTKAILIDADNEPVAGFYARTLGSPLTAVQAICESVSDFAERGGVPLRILGVGTTGAGRKFIGAIARADLVVDEITAHARAAYALDPEIDTIIEIGGQDAKFTTMRDGTVTFCHMNTVCAAGTGSFLEEQAARLGCELSEYEERALGTPAPLSSDRCAVFMERDINTFLSRGFSTNEILAAALYSVRENYLQKVARGASIGSKIAFQGATARNRALVAAFRQGLGKPIIVSRYCHLTGALGAALLLRERSGGGARPSDEHADKGHNGTTFVGLEALREEIPVRAETCGLCSNHCRLRVATIAGEAVAYGFLCGRDYDVSRYVDRNRSGFDLLKERKKAFAASRSRLSPPARPADGEMPLIGIPAALTLYGFLPIWKSFFASIGVPVITSEGFSEGIDRGREAQGAEFCAPIAALHGHVAHLLRKARHVFLPVYLEEQEPGTREPLLYCYYTQFSSALASAIGDPLMRARCLTPLVSWTKWKDRSARELLRALQTIGLERLTASEVVGAYERALAEYTEGVRRLQGRFREEMRATGEPRVVLVGRPYNVLSAEMSKGIPEIFGAQGVKAFYQDMIPYDRSDVADIASLLENTHWLHAAKILEIAQVVAGMPNLYPVYITSFKCSPDSFTLEYFKRILDARGKPYLILQLDDHDSTLGYETRIEAAVASFRNHAGRSWRHSAGRELAAFTGRGGLAAAASDQGERAGSGGGHLPVVHKVGAKLKDKTLLMPLWDPLVNPLLAANLRREGIDTRVLEEDPIVIRKAMRHNTGQCIPLNVIVEEIFEYVQRHDLDPSKTVLWMPRARLSCNLGMFPHFIKSLFDGREIGMEKVGVYTGEISHIEISPRATLNAYRAYLIGGLLRRVGCRIRPYEKIKGATNRALNEATELLVAAFEGRKSLKVEVATILRIFEGIAAAPSRRPKVAIFGDLYVRDNHVFNQDLIGAIEEAGGEVVATPYTEYMRIVAESYFRKWFDSGEYLKSFGNRAIWVAAQALGARYKRLFEPFLGVESPVDAGAVDLIMKEFRVRNELAGESFDNLLKILHLVQEHPDLRLFVQASPAFCCPSLVTEAMAKDIERLTGVPVVSITYDGTGQYRNDAVVPYLKFAIAG